MTSVKSVVNPQAAVLAAAKDMLRGLRRIMLRHVGDDVLQIVFGIFGNNDPKWH